MKLVLRLTLLVALIAACNSDKAVTKDVSIIRDTLYRTVSDSIFMTLQDSARKVDSKDIIFFSKDNKITHVFGERKYFTIYYNENKDIRIAQKEKSNYLLCKDMEHGYYLNKCGITLNDGFWSVNCTNGNINVISLLDSNNQIIEDIYVKPPSKFHAGWGNGTYKTPDSLIYGSIYDYPSCEFRSYGTEDDIIKLNELKKLIAVDSTNKNIAKKDNPIKKLLDF